MRRGTVDKKQGAKTTNMLDISPIARSGGKRKTPKNPMLAHFIIFCGVDLRNKCNRLKTLHE
jgi:hypothetical protein